MDTDKALPWPNERMKSNIFNYKSCQKDLMKDYLELSSLLFLNSMNLIIQLDLFQYSMLHWCNKVVHDADQCYEEQVCVLVELSVLLEYLLVIKVNSKKGILPQWICTRTSQYFHCDQKQSKCYSYSSNHH